jgi:catenin alpha
VYDYDGNDGFYTVKNILLKNKNLMFLFFLIFYSGRGPLRTTMDVINAAKMISECGSKLNKLAKDIAAQVN